ncbi:MAG: hypothetical protein ACE5F7_05780 [Nitrospiria bacterium]
MRKNFDKLKASLLYCNTCGRAMPVRERLLLVLSNGELYDYLCQGCGHSLGSKRETQPTDIIPVTTQTIPKALKKR